MFDLQAGPDVCYTPIKREAYTYCDLLHFSLTNFNIEQCEECSRAKKIGNNQLKPVNVNK